MRESAAEWRMTFPEEMIHTIFQGTYYGRRSDFCWSLEQAGRLVPH